jgi:hypothetical protein
VLGQRGGGAETHFLTRQASQLVTCFFFESSRLDDAFAALVDFFLRFWALSAAAGGGGLVEEEAAGRVGVAILMLPILGSVSLRVEEGVAVSTSWMTVSRRAEEAAACKGQASGEPSDRGQGEAWFLPGQAACQPSNEFPISLTAFSLSYCCWMSSL